MTQNQSALITIIMPVYNAEKTVAQSIQSVLEQTCEDWELFIIDDGSTDNTLDIIARFSDPRISLRHAARLGVGEAIRREALQWVRSEFVAFLDSDDWYAPEKLQSQLAYLKEHPECMAIGCRMTFVDEAGQVLYDNPPVASVVTPEALLRYKAVTHQQAYLYRREVFQPVAIPPYCFGDAMFLMDLLMWYPNAVHVLSDILWFYRVHDKSTVNNPVDGHAMLERCRRLYNYWGEHQGLTKQYARPVSFYITTHAHRRAMIYIRHHDPRSVHNLLKFVLFHPSVRKKDWFRCCYKSALLSFLPHWTIRGLYFLHRHWLGYARKR